MKHTWIVVLKYIKPCKEEDFKKKLIFLKIISYQFFYSKYILDLNDL